MFGEEKKAVAVHGLDDNEAILSENRRDFNDRNISDDFLMTLKR